MNREEEMIILHRDERGRPLVWCDKEIVDLVGAMYAAGLQPVASCSGHGERPGIISLADGRELIVARNYAEARAIEALAPVKPEHRDPRAASKNNVAGLRLVLVEFNRPAIQVVVDQVFGQSYVLRELDKAEAASLGRRLIRFSTLISERQT
jgi:hypothetical protein